MSTTTRKNVITRTIGIMVEHQDLDCRVPDLVVYRAFSADKVLTDPETDTFVREGVCRKEQLDQVLAGKLRAQELPLHAQVTRGGWPAAFTLVTPEYLRHNRLYAQKSIKEPCQNPSRGLGAGCVWAS